MERKRIATNGTFAGADASAYLKRVLFLSSLPALAGGLWRFAPLPGFSLLLVFLQTGNKCPPYYMYDNETDA
ncbi:MAG: hypothetical protein JAZ11_21615 [Candidatus Thiodiazotropha lotti]|nr:hypothetical protein [Candidatus Thiodiazotropha lotti]